VERSLLKLNSLSRDLEGGVQIGIGLEQACVATCASRSNEGQSCEKSGA
jgi:hypothetical protein